jgi:phospholipid-translocating ATPase
LNEVAHQLQECELGIASAGPDEKFGLALFGTAFQQITDAESELLSKRLLAVSEKCQSVVCYRTTPLQKAKILLLVKKNTGRVCLGIGDGGNDVAMIQSAGS